METLRLRLGFPTCELFTIHYPIELSKNCLSCHSQESLTKIQTLRPQPTLYLFRILVYLCMYYSLRSTRLSLKASQSLTTVVGFGKILPLIGFPMQESLGLSIHRRSADRAAMGLLTLTDRILRVGTRQKPILPFPVPG